MRILGLVLQEGRSSEFGCGNNIDLEKKHQKQVPGLFLQEEALKLR